MRQGQTIVVALLVLLLLGFVGGLFASIVTRNLRNAGRSNRIQTSDYYAEAGIRFADDQLTQSLEGADWRPPLQYKIPPTSAAFRPQGAIGAARYAAADASLPAAKLNDPDKPFLDQGFARYNLGTGRFLLRVTYDPVGLNSQATGAGRAAGSPYTDPRARYIKIEVVGREGVIVDNDPTTFVNQPAIRLAATLVEYKAIGITDYARFETNPDKRADIMALGVASAQYVADFADPTATTPTLAGYPLVTTYGAPDAYVASGTAPNQTLIANPQAGSATAANGTVAGGGSIHANGTVRFYGQNFMYLNNNNQNSGAFGEAAEIGGSLLVDNYTDQQTLDKQASGLALNPVPAGAAVADYVAPSNAPTTFDTHTGLVRDSGSGTDVNGLPRGANRLEPPSLDTANPATNLPRYKDLAFNALPRQSFDAAATTGYGPAASPSSYSLGSARLGYGRSVYVDNTGDMQKESTSLLGGYTLVDEWLHRTAPGQGSASWSGGFYRPPGVDIVLGRQSIVGNDTTTPVKTFYGMRLTRSDVDTSGAPVLWKNPDGTPITTLNPDGNTGSTLYVSYTSLNASNINSPATLTGTSLDAYRNNPSNDVIVYAEGNVRVRGTVSAPVDANGNATSTVSSEGTSIDTLPRHVTIVTNGTAYIDGSLLRGSPQSSIAVLAHDYVCVNTTQFLAGAQVEDNPIGTTPPGPSTGDPNLQALDFSTSDEVLLQEFQYLKPVVKATATANTPYLYVSAGPGSPGSAAIDIDFSNRATGTSLTTGSTNSLFQPLVGAAVYTSVGAGPNGLTHTTYALAGTGTIISTQLTPGDPYQFAVRRDPGTDQAVSTQDLLLERAAVLPADINIEAVLFAQTKSFFIIPGTSFNTSADDTLTTFLQNATRPDLTGLSAGTEYTNRSRYPFYGQPIDMKITVRGSVSEARPADVSAQTAWMQNWGWIPKVHGSLLTATAQTVELSNRTAINISTTQTSAPIGLTFLYNPLAGYPYMVNQTTPANTGYLRTDIYGRPLPYAPKLPVCAGQLYAGQNAADQPVLQ